MDKLTAIHHYLTVDRRLWYRPPWAVFRHLGTRMARKAVKRLCRTRVMPPRMAVRPYRMDTPARAMDMQLRRSDQEVVTPMALD